MVFTNKHQDFTNKNLDLTSKNQDLASKDQDLSKRLSVFSAKRLDGTINLKNFLYRDLMPDLFIMAINLWIYDTCGEHPTTGKVGGKRCAIFSIYNASQRQ